MLSCLPPVRSTIVANPEASPPERIVADSLICPQRRSYMRWAADAPLVDRLFAARDRTAPTCVQLGDDPLEARRMHFERSRNTAA